MNSPDNSYEISDERLAFIAAQTPDLLGAASSTGRFTWLNARWQETLGWTRAELMAKPYIEFVHPSDVASTLEEAAGIEAGGRAVLFLNRYQHKDGTWRWLEWNSRLSQSGDEVVFVARDVTTRVEAQEARSRALNLLSLAEQVGRTGHWYVDLRAQTVFWSSEVYRIHGLDPEKFTPTLETAVDAYHPDDRARVSAAVGAAMEEGKPFEFELRIIRPSGEIRRVQSFGRPEVSGGKITGIFGVFRDIADDESARRIEELEQFAYFAGHDLREPVRTIQSYLGLLEDELPELDEETKRHWDFVVEAGARLKQLTEGLLLYTRAGQPLERTPVELSHVIEDALASMRSSIEEADARIEVAAPLPRVLGERTQLTQVFLNLIGNALKFRGEELAPEIHISCERSHGHWHVEVRDNGIGFDEENAEKIFMPFRRLHGRSEYEGAGIGLSIVKRIANECGGNAWARPAKGGGSRFFVSVQAA